MGKFTHAMIHCTDTPRNMDVTPEHIRKWHIEERGWSRVGYSCLWSLDGEEKILIPHNEDDVIESWEISNGARGWNGNTRHFAYAGGMGNIDTRTYEQKTTMRKTIFETIENHPDIKWIGHNQVNRWKYCPSFDVPSWLLTIGVHQKNIDFNQYYNI